MTRRGDIGVALGLSGNVSRKRRCRKTGRTHVVREPEQAMADFHGAARGVETVAVIVVAGNVREYGLQMRVSGHRRFPLRDAQVGAAIHTHPAVRPRLARDPVQRVVAVVDFLVDRFECAAGSIAAAHVLHDDNVTVIHEGLIGGRDRIALPVGCAQQDRGIARRRAWTEDVRAQYHAIAHGHSCVVCADRGRRLPHRLHRRAGGERQRDQDRVTGEDNRAAHKTSQNRRATESRE